MKTLFLSAIAVVALAFTGNAQEKPAASPASMTKQTVGLTEITVEYSRPSVKDRDIFGDLVPYGEVWRAGANAATKVTVSTDCNIGGADLKAGSYALLITPEKDEWTLHFFPYEGARWADYRDGDSDAVVGKSSEIKKTSYSIESWGIMFDYLRDNSANMHLIWERANVVIPITVP